VEERKSCGRWWTGAEGDGRWWRGATAAGTGVSSRRVTKVLDLRGWGTGGGYLRGVARGRTVWSRVRESGAGSRKLGFNARFFSAATKFEKN
jgi:hypothetical protein